MRTYLRMNQYLTICVCPWINTYRPMAINYSILDLLIKSLFCTREREGWKCATALLCKPEPVFKTKKCGERVNSKSRLFLTVFMNTVVEEWGFPRKESTLCVESQNRYYGGFFTYLFWIQAQDKAQDHNPSSLPLHQLFERRGDGTCRNPGRSLVETLSCDWWDGEQMWAAVAVF